MLERARRRGLQPAARHPEAEVRGRLPEHRLAARADRLGQHVPAGGEAGPVLLAREKRRHRVGRRPDAGAGVRHEQQHGEHREEPAEHARARRRRPERADHGDRERRIEREAHREDVVEQRQELRAPADRDRLMPEHVRQRDHLVPADDSLGPSERYVTSEQRGEQEPPAVGAPAPHGVEDDDQRAAGSRRTTPARCCCPGKCFATECAHHAPTASRCDGMNRFSRSAV